MCREEIHMERDKEKLAKTTENVRRLHVAWNNGEECQGAQPQNESSQTYQIIPMSCHQGLSDIMQRLEQGKRRISPWDE